jgi:ABC-type sulfate transport system substrate-binding protein
MGGLQSFRVSHREKTGQKVTIINSEGASGDIV